MKKIKEYFPLSGDIIYLEIMLFCSYPYVFSQFLPIPRLSVLFAICLFINAFYLTLNISRFNKCAPIPKAFTLIFIIQCAFHLFAYLYHSDSYYLFRIFYATLAYSFLYIIYCQHNLGKFIVVNNSILSLQAVLGFIAFILIFVGVLQPLFEFENIDTRLSTCYGLTCGKGIGNIQRVCGYFDEPGSLAFWGIFALLFNKLFVKNKKIELALIIGLTVTLSMAFYIQLALYLFFYYFNKKSIKYLIPITAILGLLAYYIYSQGFDSELFRLTFGRFGLGGYDLDNNREDLMAMARQMFKSAPLLGNGEYYISQQEYMADNPYENLAVDGIIGTVIIYLPLLFLLMNHRYRKIDTVKAIIILFVGYLQRPFHMQLIHYIMLYSFTLCVLSNKDCQKFFAKYTSKYKNISADNVNR